MRIYIYTYLRKILPKQGSLYNRERIFLRIRSEDAIPVKRRAGPAPHKQHLKLWIHDMQLKNWTYKPGNFFTLMMVFKIRSWTNFNCSFGGH